jgi:tetratricopeptide (TPR) repeat protein
MDYLNVTFINKSNMKTRILSLLVLFTFLGITAFGQSASKYIKTGDTFFKAGNFDEAIAHYTKAIELQPDNVNAYNLRAKTFEKQSKFNLALEDYKRIIILNPKDKIVFFNTARMHQQLKQWEDAVAMSSKYIELDKKSINAYDIKVNSLLELKRFEEALADANKALAIKKMTQTYILRGKVYFQTKKFTESEADYRLAVKKESSNEVALVGLANALFELNKLNEAMVFANKVITQNEQSFDAYLIRSKIYHKKVEFPSAINDLSKVIVLFSNDPRLPDIFLQRGIYYLEFNQHINAINDFTRAINQDSTKYVAYFKRAAAYEAISKYDAAAADYEAVEKLNVRDLDARDLIAQSKQRLFELKKEENKPEVVITNPKIRKEGELEVLKGSKQVTIEGLIKDQSSIEYFKVNDNVIVYNKDRKDNPWQTTITVEGVEEFTISVSDVYHNVTNNRYKIVWSENNAPVIRLISPYASDNKVIFLNADDQVVQFQGVIEDESLIQSVFVEGANASFIPDRRDPAFNASVELLNKDKITIRAIDIYGNEKSEEFLINRGGMNLAEVNPMGKTWVIFIENTNYKTFASLEGPAKDVNLVKSAMSKYDVQNIIHKKDLSKLDMEKFFSIELRDLVRSNGVNSLLIWYAGHGKFVNEAGYWIPVDARRDDEFTYFNISALRSSLQSYSSTVMHTLVITDACESGPSFYQAMRATPKVRSCGDWQSTRFRSSQVFSSAGYELAADNSQFTRTFVNSLIANPDKCIPIDNIVVKVTEAVGKGQSQKPKFGKINGLEDEDGTFFFIKK